MDDATRLISELQAQLAELDHKVTTYRQDLADGFLRHSRQLLSDLDPSLSARVQDALAHCLGSYPAISPALITGSAADLEAPIFGTAALVTGSPALTFQAPGPLVVEAKNCSGCSAHGDCNCNRDRASGHSPSAGISASINASTGTSTSTSTSLSTGTEPKFQSHTAAASANADRPWSHFSDHNQNNPNPNPNRPRPS
ncbi:unnamed protein product [Parascedosporium putredinis]|uniref:Uncharacterized protein n=1 Tax=Parascedosporium putredinis TaxID=1442378 RepID=A0A9P1HCH4_9PEZI|nr:unnamed protein product [Parascedosporium putredinis]CAI8004374.1 unnamed protein product [Parascedosporium putredinis]